MSEGSRRRVSYTQLETLWEFLNTHRDIATGYNKTARARDTSKRVWQEVAQALNAQGDGAVKDWKGWSKYWNDYKSKIKKTVASIRSSQQRTGGGPSSSHALSEIEKKFLIILGDSFGSGLPGIRIEPFNQETENVESSDPASQNLLGSNIILEQVVLTEHSTEPTAHAGGGFGVSGGTNGGAGSSGSGQDNTFHESSPQPGPSRLDSLSQSAEPTRQPGLSAATPERRNPSPALTLRRSPRARPPRPRPRTLLSPGSPRERRRRRREPPMSQEAARRALIMMSTERRQIDQTRNELLQRLIQEIAEIKELLRTRLPVPELPETPILP